MIKVEEISLLKDSHMLQGMSEEQMGKLASFLDKRDMEAGTTVFIENMPGESLFLIKKGAIQISKMFAEGDEEPLAELGPEDVFGELAIIDGLPRAATARVKESAELISLNKNSFDKLCQQDAELGLKLLNNIVKVFSRRVHEAHQEYRTLLAWSLEKS